MPQPGKLFVFEGRDGVGKTTLSKWFAGALEKRGYRSVLWSSFPGHEKGTIGNLVHKLHHDPAAFGIHKLEPLSLQLLHVAAHIDAIGSRFQKWIHGGKILVLDRFWWSTWVYGRLAGGDVAILEAMIEVEKLAWRNIQPAKIFLVSRPPGETKEHKTLEKLYVQLARRENRSVPISHIQNDGDLREAQDRILSAL